MDDDMPHGDLKGHPKCSDSSIIWCVVSSMEKRNGDTQFGFLGFITGSIILIFLSVLSHLYIDLYHHMKMVY